MTSPEIPDSGSPYWLRLYGHWTHLQGIMPVVDTVPERAFNGLTTVDGYRYEQRAPRGPRSWDFSFRYATAAATAALESAAYDVVYNDEPSGRTLLLDTNAAKVNMLPPEIPTQQRFSTGRPVINAGGVWAPSYSSVAAETTTQYVPVRAGITYTAAVWTNAAAAAVVMALLKPGDFGPTGYSATGGGTAVAPELVTATVTPATDGEVIITVAPPTDATKSVAGLMFFEGDCEPETYRRGRRMPCQVSVRDPSITSNLIWSKNCDPCDLPREHSGFTVVEVGDAPITEQA